MLCESVLLPGSYTQWSVVGCEEKHFVFDWIAYGRSQCEDDMFAPAIMFFLCLKDEMSSSAILCAPEMRYSIYQ